MNNFFSYENMNRLGRFFFFYSIILLLLSFEFINFFSISLKSYQPTFIYIVVFFWSVYRPSLLPPILLFVVGVVQDILLLYPVGLHAILLLVFQFFIVRQRLFLLGQTHFALWMIFSVSCFLLLSLEWFVFSIYHWSIYDFEGLAVKGIISILVYPFVSLLFWWVYKILPTAYKSGQSFIDG